MDEVSSNVYQINQNIPWYFKYQIFLCLGVSMGSFILENWFSKNVTGLMFILGIFNLSFLIPQEDNFFQKKFGKGVKGFIFLNLAVAISYLCFVSLGSLLLSVLQTYFPPQVVLGLKILFGLSSWAYVIFVLYRDFKSTNK